MSGFLKCKMACADFRKFLPVYAFLEKEINLAEIWYIRKAENFLWLLRFSSKCMKMSRYYDIFYYFEKRRGILRQDSQNDKMLCVDF